MQSANNYTGTAAKVWQQVEKDLATDAPLLQYKAVLQVNYKPIMLQIDIDPGGGFDSGYAYTAFSTALHSQPHFRLSAHKQTVLEAAGKLVGLEDVEIGYPEFDKKIIIKTNDADKARKAFSSEEARKTLTKYSDFSLELIEETEATGLHLKIEEALTDRVQLQELFTAFETIALALDNSEAAETF